ncbi:MAG TPA: MFS transporter [Mycobacteriales bacterium]|nr:MFS transporter [Mycobacteriales bacterium]
MPPRARTPNRWLILVLGLAAQAAASSYLYGLPMLLPQLRHEGDLSLASAGWLVAAPSIGLLVTLIPWGALVDRRGERGVMVSGLVLAGGFLVGAAATDDYAVRLVLLVLAGAGGGSVNSAGGRLVLGWFEPHERGTAMGWRQTAQPLGVALAAATFPPIANTWGIGWAIALPAALCVVVAAMVEVFVVDPPRLPRSATEPAPTSPYRGPTLWRLHFASAMLVVPQFAVSAFALTYLVSERHWGTASAGRLLFAFQLAGAAGRVASGVWSDRVGNRLGPMRMVAAAAAVTMLAAGIGAANGWLLAVVALGVGVVVTVADNGLGFTATAELAGSSWAGRAMGVQNTGQNLTAALTPPLLGALITAHGFGWGFGVVALFPLIAVFATPVAAETGRVALPKPATLRV